MIPRTTRNLPRLQTPCAACHHTEWDHYIWHGDSRTACDSGGCRCHEFTTKGDNDMSKWTDPRLTPPDDNHELRELRWRVKELNKVCGRQGETIHRLRGELADVRQLNSKIERGQIRNLERMLAWSQRDVERLRANLITARECNARQQERLHAASQDRAEVPHG